MQILTSPEFLDTTTIAAHQGVGSSTGEIIACAVVHIVLLIAWGEGCFVKNLKQMVDRVVLV